MYDRKDFYLLAPTVLSKQQQRKINKQTKHAKRADVSTLTLFRVAFFAEQLVIPKTSKKLQKTYSFNY